jgi:hypothetical protein
MPGHDDAVSWSRVVVEVDDLSDWTWEWHGNLYSARGPCPRCHAPDQAGSTYAWGTTADGEGDDASDGSLGGIAGDAVGPHGSQPDREPAAGPDPNTEVDVACECAPGHAKDKTGCGARWVVRVGDLP